ncbi:alpha/beta hydrolase [uncultured Pantoea sp.]|uniref:alpha/beta fold hydrolase n=1 Tax=uncultured Pantoea sp. TaxID=218084 RepID=UPI0025EBA018|nr:alpha/beta hydrolase [uncultured Pantoea sp.]
MFIGVLMLFSATLFAAEKQYSITAPDGVKLAVQESGNPDGLPIVFIHGLLGSHLNWEKQISDAQLQQRYRLITFDMRGHGLSDKPEQESAYRDGKRWADDLRAVINQIHANKPLLVGWSLGGAVITNYLAAYGDGNISGAIYVDGVVELNPTLIPAHDVYGAMTASDLKTHLDGERAFLQLCFYQQPDRTTFERLLANAALAAWPMQRAVPTMTIALEKGVKNVRVPLLFIYGEHDALVNPAASLARVKRINSRIQTQMFADSGHAPFIEEPARFNRTLATFASAL